MGGPIARVTGGMPVCAECGGWGEHLTTCSHYPRLPRERTWDHAYVPGPYRVCRRCGEGAQKGHGA